MSQFKRKLKAFSAMLAFISLSSAATFAASLGDVMNNTGNVGFNSVGNKFDVNINSGMNGDVGQVDWKDFNVGKNEHVNFGFSGLSQTIINRVLGGNESQILGKLTNSCINDGSCTSFAATSKVILINPAGIMFGQGSTVDLNSFTASTFDINGAKNLKGMTQAQMEAYQADVLNKFSPVAGVNGENRNYGNIKFDSNYTQEFAKAGITLTPGETQIVLDGTHFNHFDENGNVINANPNKTVNIISDNIQYRDSLIKTGDNFNYQTPNSNKSFSNVRLITADGVTFSYVENGYANDYEVAQDTKNVERNIDIDNKNLAKGQESITSGDIHIVNQSNKANSNIKIANSIIKGTKLVSQENGDIFIKGSHDINIDNTRLETVNTSVEKDGVTYSTKSQSGGEVYLSAGKNANVNNSLIITAGSTGSSENAGKVRVYAFDGNIKADGTKIISQGDIDLIATDDITLTNSLAQANNTLDSSKTKDVTITASGNIKAHNAAITATDDVEIKSIYSDNSVAGNIIVSSDLDKDGKNQTLIIAGDKLSLQGSNTTLDNASAVYQDLKFYNDGTTGKNNVTIANNSTFSPTNSTGGVGGDINIETNGNVKLDNATVKRASYELKFDRNADGSLIDDKTPSAINYNINVNPANANNINIKSTEGDVIATNNTNVVARDTIKLTSDKGNVNIDKTTLKTTKNNIDITASKGSVNIKDNSTIDAGKDLNVTAYNSITFGKKGDNKANIDNSSKLSAKENMNITSLNGDINGEKTTMPTLSYGDRLTFDAKGSNNFTSENSLKAVNVDFKAGKANNITTKGDVQFVNSTLESPNNNITTTQEGGDVIMNNLTIKSATANPKDTVTKINAKGNVTTKDVTGTAADDVAKATKTFPQDVDFEDKVTDKATPDTILDVNKTKLIVNTKVNKVTPKNNDNGSITLTVKNADNANAGVDLTAQNESWDEQIDKGEGPEVHLNAADNKVAITNIYTDKLTLDKGDKFIAGKDTKDGSMPTITVKDQGGFNMDPNVGYDPQPDGFEYDKNITERTETSDTVRIWDEEKGEYIISKTDNETVYGKDYVDRTTITTTDREHEIHFGEDGEEQFKLIYEKTDVKINDVPGTVTRTESECPELPEIEKDNKDVDSYINIIKLPREQVEISKTSKVSDNTVDQTSSIMSAAAKVDLAAADGMNTSADKDEDEE